MLLSGGKRGARPAILLGSSLLLLYGLWLFSG